MITNHLPPLNPAQALDWISLSTGVPAATHLIDWECLDLGIANPLQGLAVEFCAELPQVRHLPRICCRGPEPGHSSPWLCSRPGRAWRRLRQHTRTALAQQTQEIKAAALSHVPVANHSSHLAPKQA